MTHLARETPCLTFIHKVCYHLVYKIPMTVLCTRYPFHSIKKSFNLNPDTDGDGVDDDLDADDDNDGIPDDEDEDDDGDGIDDEDDLEGT